MLGSRATGDFMVPAATLPTCTFDSDCSVPFGPGGFLFGGQRHGCVDHDGDGSTPNLCDLVQLELRRLYVGPRGIDLIIADGPDDPQFPPINGRPYPPPRFPEDVVSCSPSRLVLQPLRTLASGIPVTPDPRGVLDGHSTGVISDLSLRVCDGTETGTSAGNCVCAETGTTCGNSVALGVAGFGMWPGGTLACQLGRCCTADGTTCASRLTP